MNQSNSDAALLSLALDRRGPEPLHAQLAAALRGLILSGALPPGTRLPPSRVLAAELSVSRSTVVTALDQLTSEGYAEGRRGAGVFVPSDLPEQVLQAVAAPGDTPPGETPPGNARPGAPARPAPLPRPAPLRPFQAAVPDPDLFPHRDWTRLFDQVWRRPGAALSARPDPLGWPELREEIAAHLGAWRGLPCDPAQVIVTSGAAESLDLIGRALLAPGDEVLVEDPGYAATARALAAAGLCPRPVAVDAQGFDPARGRAAWPEARGVVVTPSRHYPLGVTLPLARRLELIDWARATGGLVIEDDYDSEFRYTGAPLPALAGLDHGGRALYLGSFSKVLSPALRLGFMVLPPALVPAVAALLVATGPRAGLMLQPVLARFMAEGGLAAHIRRMRREYARRQAALVAAAAEHLHGVMEVAPAEAGMHLVGRLLPGLSARMSDEEAARIAAAAGVELRPLSDFVQAGYDVPRGLVMGYAAFDPVALADAAARLGRALRG